MRESGRPNSRNQKPRERERERRVLYVKLCVCGRVCQSCGGQHCGCLAVCVCALVCTAAAPICAHPAARVPRAVFECVLTPLSRPPQNQTPRAVITRARPLHDKDTGGLPTQRVQQKNALPKRRKCVCAREGESASVWLAAQGALSAVMTVARVLKERARETQREGCVHTVCVCARARCRRPLATRVAWGPVARGTTTQQQQPLYKK